MAVKIKEEKAEGKAEGAANTIIRVLLSRFSKMPEDVEMAIRGISEMDRLSFLADQAAL